MQCLEKGIDFKCTAADWRAHAMVEHPRGDPDSIETCRICAEKGIDFKCTVAEFRAHAMAEHPREKKSPAAKKGKAGDTADMAIDSAAPKTSKADTLQVCKKCAEKGIDFKCTRGDFRAHAMAEHPRVAPDELLPCRKCAENGVDFKCTTADFRAHAMAEHPREKKSPAAKKVAGAAAAVDSAAMAIDSAAPKASRADTLQVCKKCAEKGIDFKCTRGDFRAHAMAEHPRGPPEEVVPCRKCAEKGIDFKCANSEWKAHADIEHPREKKAPAAKTAPDAKPVLNPTPRTTSRLPETTDVKPATRTPNTQT